MADPASTTSPAAALTALADLADCYRRLLALGPEQTRCVFAGDTDGLLAVLTRRESLADDAASLEKSLSPLRRDWRSATKSWPDDRRDAAAAAFVTVRDLMAELSKRDDRDAATLRARMATTRAELGRAVAEDRAVRRVNQSYARTAYARRDRRVDVSR